jgi:hypothetical protein
MTKEEKEAKFKRWQISVLLHANAALNSELGRENTAKEKKFVKDLLRENNNKIKEIDVEFYKSIKESGEVS